MNNVVKAGLGSVLGAPIGIPFGVPHQELVSITPAPKRPSIPGEDLPRALTYLADYGGCGYYRCMAPDFLLNLNQRAIVTEASCMIFEPRMYKTIKAVKFQRQATDTQRKFIEELCTIKDKLGFKIIYEVDDVVFAEDIPLYNKNRTAFDVKNIQDNIRAILPLVDEITVTTNYFKQYLQNKTGIKNVTSIPNYLMKWWFDRYYNLGNLIKQYEKNKKRPKISIFASGTHVDVRNVVNQQDDFEEILPHIIRTRKDYEWHFFGCLPLGLSSYVKDGSIKYTKWVELPEFPEVMHKSESQLTFAALRDNQFNRCKSNIKLIEAGALGLPCVCPDLNPYEEADLKYKTGDEFIDTIKYALKNQTVYANLCKKARALSERYWLDSNENLSKHYEAYFTPFGSSNRTFLT